MIRNNKLKVRDLQNNCKRDLSTCSHFRVIISKEQILYVLQTTSKMRFYFCVSVIVVSMFLFHTCTVAYESQKLVPANPSKCPCEVTTNPHVLRDLSKVLIHGSSNCNHICKLCIYDKNYTPIKAFRYTTYCFKSSQPSTLQKWAWPFAM
jgi:hypothetical protein